MKIRKKLKNAEFEYDEETKTFTIMEEDGFHGHIQLNKVYAFAFVRFVVRMAQRNWFRDKKSIDKTIEDVLECSDQLEMF
jgi:hypothetical protein|tara:strand:- start:467 stop:706 length:240 start_codon:yes stop_codon:yes gene_type:complete